MRTGVASGKKRAKSAAGLVLPARARAIPCCGTIIPFSTRLKRGGDSRLLWRSADVACEAMRVGLPLFPVRKSLGEPEHAVMAGRGARPLPLGGTEGVALRR